jgi:transposase-like protein
METLPRQVYTAEFRQKAVELITRDRLSIAEVARRLAISPKTLLNWIRRAKSGNLPDDGDGVRRREVSEQEVELSRLRRENAELRMERDILKKRARTSRKSLCALPDDQRATTGVSAARPLPRA